MREHATENDMHVARNADFKALLEGHRTAIAALPEVTPLSGAPTLSQLRNYDIQHTERRKMLVEACTNYRRKVQELISQHQAEEHVLRTRLQALAVATKSPPVTSP